MVTTSGSSHVHRPETERKRKKILRAAIETFGTQGFRQRHARRHRRSGRDDPRRRAAPLRVQAEPAPRRARVPRPGRRRATSRAAHPGRARSVRHLVDDRAAQRAAARHRAGLHRALRRVGHRRPPRRRPLPDAYRTLRAEIDAGVPRAVRPGERERPRHDRQGLRLHPRRHGRTPGAVAARPRRRRSRAGDASSPSRRSWPRCSARSRPRSGRDRRFTR